MSFGENWVRHLFAIQRGEPLSDELASDFWPSEKLWDVNSPVKMRWLKFCWVYIVSALIQGTLPACLIAVIIRKVHDLFTGETWSVEGLLLLIFVMSGLGLVIGVLFGLGTSLWLRFRK